MSFTCSRKSTFIFAFFLLTCAVSAYIDDYDEDELDTLRSLLASGVTKGLPAMLTDDDPPPADNSRQEDEVDDDVYLRYPPPSQKENSKSDSDVIRYWLQTKRANVKSNKRNISCMWKCLKQGKLHASQCHSLC